jgi:ATP-dependent protease HslVU (ClpYQ) peptidase subunit
MTCIVGLIDKEKGEILIGGDSCGGDATHYHCQIRKDPKVFKRNEFIMGFTSSFRMGQLLMSDNRFSIREQRSKESDYEYMVSAFIPAIQKLFSEGGYIEKDKEVLSGGCFIVGYKSNLYEIQSDFQVAEFLVTYMAVGCGEFYALASLYNTEKSKLTPRQRIIKALETAAHFSAYVRPPFNIISSKYKPNFPGHSNPPSPPPPRKIKPK